MFLKDDLKGKAKIEEITEGKENYTSAAKLGISTYFLIQSSDVFARCYPL